MNHLLKIKPWKLFIIILAPALVPSTNLVFKLIEQVGTAIYIIWLFAIGSTMWGFFYKTLKPDIILFKIGCFLLLSILIAYTVTDPFKILYSQPWFWWILIPLLSINFYILAFAARMLGSVIQNKKIGFRNSFNIFLGLWFFPIGIWYIQPMIKRVLDDRAVEVS